MSFVHLRSHSAYSLLKGAIKIPKLVALAKADGMPALGLSIMTICSARWNFLNMR